jgi:hypothetical protein
MHVQTLLYVCRSKIYFIILHVFVYTIFLYIQYILFFLCNCKICKILRVFCIHLYPSGYCTTRFCACAPLKEVNSWASCNAEDLATASQHVHSETSNSSASPPPFPSVQTGRKSARAVPELLAPEEHAPFQSSVMQSFRAGTWTCLQICVQGCLAWPPNGFVCVNLSLKHEKHFCSSPK